MRGTPRRPTCRAAWRWCRTWRRRPREGDLVITMGAGDVTAIGPQLVDALAAGRRRGGRRSRRCREVRRAVSARHTTALEALLVDDRFDGDVYPAEPMARHTMYRIGGPARFYVQTASVGALVRLVEVCEQHGRALGGGGTREQPAGGRRGLSRRGGHARARLPHVPLRRGGGPVLRGCGRAAVVGGAGGVPPLAGGAGVRRGHAGHRGRRAAHERRLARRVDRRARGIRDHAARPGGGLARRAGDEIALGLPHQLVRAGRGHRGMRTFRRAGRSVLHPR